MQTGWEGGFWTNCRYPWGKGEDIPDGGVSMGKSTRSERMGPLGEKIE